MDFTLNDGHTIPLTRVCGMPLPVQDQQQTMDSHYAALGLQRTNVSSTQREGDDAVREDGGETLCRALTSVRFSLWSSASAAAAVVSVQASEDEIRSAYKSLSLTRHPDKLRRALAANPAARAEAQAAWDRIEEAHRILSYPLSRAQYDLLSGFVPDSDETHARIARLKRKDAQRIVATMEETVAQNRAVEEAKNGLLIMSARFGDLSVSEEEAAQSVSAPYIDVAVQLQYLVSDSQLIFAPGHSLADAEGFYDPSMGVNPGVNRLAVRYKFLGYMHQAEFDDGQEILIPLQEHCIQEEWEAEQAALAAEGMAAPANAAGGRAAATRASHGATRSSMRASSAPGSASRATLLARQKARRRMILYSTLAAAGVGFYLLRRNNVTVASAQGSMTRWADSVRRFIAEKMAQWSAYGATQRRPIVASSSSSAPVPIVAASVAAPATAAAL